MAVSFLPFGQILSFQDTEINHVSIIDRRQASALKFLDGTSVPAPAPARAQAAGPMSAGLSRPTISCARW
jgi:hypothetical protein